MSAAVYDLLDQRFIYFDGGAGAPWPFRYRGDLIEVSADFPALGGQLALCAVLPNMGFFTQTFPAPPTTTG